jgi:hypothetical protein
VRQRHHRLHRPHHVGHLITGEAHVVERGAVEHLHRGRQVGQRGAAAGEAEERPRLLTLAGRADPGAIAEDVGHGDTAHGGERAGGHGERDQEPVVGVDQTELHEQQRGQVGGVRGDRAEVGAAVPRRPTSACSACR